MSIVQQTNKYNETITDLTNGVSPELVAQRLNTDEATLLQTLANDPVAKDQLLDVMTMRMLVRTYTTFMLATTEIENNMDKMDPSHLAKFYSTLASLITTLMGHRENTIDIILNALPPEAKTSVLRLLKSG